MAIKHERTNFLISAAAMVLTVFSFKVMVLSGITYQSGKIIDQVLIKLGLMPEHIIDKLAPSTGPSYSYVPVNIALFIVLNLVLGFIAFKLIGKRSAMYSGRIYGISMTLVFLLVSSTLVIQSGDGFNWICVLWGVALTLFIQILLATIMLTTPSP